MTQSNFKTPQLYKFRGRVTFVLLFVLMAMAAFSTSAFAQEARQTVKQATNQIDQADQADNSAILWWRFDEEQNASEFADSSGNNRKGSCEGFRCPETGIDGKINKAAHFVTESADIVAGDLATAANDNVSLATWVKWGGPSSAGGVLIYNGDSSINGFGVYVGTDGKVNLLAGGIAFAPSSATLTAGTWQHVAAIRRNGVLELFVDGARASVTGNPAPNPPTTRFVVGDSFNGDIDEARVYNHALSLEEIKSLAIGDAGAGLNKCSTPNGESIALIRPAESEIIVGVTLEKVTIKNITASGCDVTGDLRIVLPGNNLTVYASGKIDVANNFYSNFIAPFSLNIAGMTLRSHAPQFNRNVLAMALSEMVAPLSLGGGRVPLLITPHITDKGLKTVGDLINAALGGVLKLPELETEAGLRLASFSVELISEANGYRLNVSGELGLPTIQLKGKNGAQDVGIGASFAIYANAQGNTTIQFASTKGMEPLEIVNPTDAATTQPANSGCFDTTVCLGSVGLSLNASPGINLDQGYAGGTIWLTGVRGSITLLKHDTKISVGLTIATSTLSLPLLGDAISVDGDATIEFAPELGIALKSATKFFILTLQESEVSLHTKKGFRAAFTRVGVSTIPIRMEGEVRIWGSGDKYYITGSGRAGWYLKKGEIFQACSWSPCIQSCGTHWVFNIFRWRWEEWPKPCAITWCYQCLNIPDYEIWLAGGTVDMGSFKNNIFGAKSSVHFLGFTTGTFLDLVTGQITFGNVSGYQLDAPTVQRALARLRSLEKSRVSLEPSAIAPLVAAPDANTVVLAAPVGGTVENPMELSAMRHSLDATTRQRMINGDLITSTNVLTQSDTLFNLTSFKPLTMSLLIPDNANVPVALRGQEVTSANYASFAPDLLIGYRTAMTYTGTFAGSEPRLRYVGVTLTPMTVTVQLDGQAIFTDVLFPTHYISITPGSHEINISAQNMIASRRTADALPLTAITNTDVTLLAYDNNGTLATKVLVGDRTPPTALGMGKVRFVNVFAHRNDGLKLYVGGQLVASNVAAQGVSPYVELPSGSHLVEVKDASEQTVVTTTLELKGGEQHTLVTSSETVTRNDTPELLVLVRDILDDIQVAVMLQEFQVDQAPVGAWQVKLNGEVDDPNWRLNVINPANPPVISNFVMDGSDPSAVNLSLNVRSDYAPTTLSFFVVPGPITITTRVTDSNGVMTLQPQPLFHGSRVDVITITEKSLLNGNIAIQHKLDLAHLASGDYYVWVQVEDGISPSVNQYAALQSNARFLGERTVRVAAASFDTAVQTANAGTIHIDHTASYPNHFASSVISHELDIELYQWDVTACPNAASDPDCTQVDGVWGKWVFMRYLPLFYRWTPSNHPDTTNYLIEIQPLSSAHVTQTQFFTISHEVSAFLDENDNLLGIFGSHGWKDAFPDSHYRIRIGAHNNVTKMTSWSPAKDVVIPLGSIGVKAAQSSFSLAAGSKVTTTVTVTWTDDLFYDLDLQIDSEGLPSQLQSTFIDSSGRSQEIGRISPMGRQAPTDAPAKGESRFFATSTPYVEEIAGNGRMVETSSEQVDVVIETASNLAPGIYTVPVVITSGPLHATATVQITVVDNTPRKVYLPVVSR